MQPLKARVYHYKQLLEQGANMAVIDQYYDEQISQLENDQTLIVGKQQLRDLEAENLAKVTALQQQITSLVVDENQELVMGEMTIRFTSKQGGTKQLNQAFVQRWKAGKIFTQRFYYGGFISIEEA